MNQKQIPTSNSKEDIKAREKIIINFYHEWKRNNPSQRLYNLDLKDLHKYSLYLYCRDG